MTTTFSCACGASAVWNVYGKNVQDDCCDPCYIKFYRDNDQDSRAWEADRLSNADLIDIASLIDSRDDALTALAERDAEIEGLARCLNAANKQYDNLEAVARLACAALEAIVEDYDADSGPPPADAVLAYNKLYAELHPPESEPPTDNSGDLPY